jgi:hypothetical protein
MKMNKDIQKHESKQGTIDNCVMNLINGSFNVQKTSDSSSSIKEYSDSMISTEFLEVNEYQHRYDCDRLAEFIDRTASILHNRLQPGFAKSSKGKSPLFLGQCPYRLFTFFMDLYPCKKKKRILHPIRDGIRVNIVKHYFIFDSVLPDLGGWKWYIRNHHQVKSCESEVRSMYTSIVFIINEDDDRVFFHFEQVTQFYFCGHWIDTCYFFFPNVDLRLE